MGSEWAVKYCEQKPHCVHDFKVEWDAHRFMLCGKMFVMMGADKAGEPIITIKCTPASGEVLRAQYKDIVPGYYMNKLHWNSVYVKGSVPQQVVAAMIDEAYALVFGALSKKQQQLLSAGE